VVVLAHLLFFGVTDDDNVAVTRWPKKTTIEVIKQFAGEVLVLRSIWRLVVLIHWGW
jgi:hypothetical protein